LISQILDLSKIEAGKVQIEPRAISLRELRSYVEGTFSQVAAQKGLNFKVAFTSDAPATVTSDEQRLQQILKNLLSNAFKFTDHGEVELTIGRADGHPTIKRGKGVLAFTVSDSGIGIPPDKQQLIFDAFQQADTSTSRMYGGTGLGLTISSDLAHLLGGEIELRSTPGVGSSFTLYLPLGAGDLDTLLRDVAEGQPTPMPRLRDPISRPSVELSGKKVLLIDDDARNLFAITSLLERVGVEVIAASSAQEGLSELEAHRDIELVVLDIMLPGMDGFQAAQHIRKMDSHAAALPIIALTAKAMPGDREKCIEAGCTDFVPKPVDSEVLISLMKDHLSARA
jgi:CheY-like chemotaxis protein/two-component sensor histidine kinase